MASEKLTSKKISYVIAVYNAERTMEECLNSIIAQDYPKENYEIVIADGGSDDATLSIVNNFMERHGNIRLYDNPNKLAEGVGNGRDIAINNSHGEILIQLDSDNILESKEWTKEMLFPFYDNPEIDVVQSSLTFTEDDNSFIKYVNSIGVEDAFAVPYSLVAQTVFNPKIFKLIKNRYYLYNLTPKKVLYGGANGCAFKKEVLRKMNGWTRDNDVFAYLANLNTKVGVIKRPGVIHKTSVSLYTFLKKKGAYFIRFIEDEHKEREFKWVEDGLRGKAQFMLMVLFNLSILGPLFVSMQQFRKTAGAFWFWHPIALFVITLEYGLLTSMNLKHFFEYSAK